ncbi:MAG TPA: mechanosensitive ion channel domain-containing protein [Vicinamibacterales bacterium]|nr:mechanosensitive ion channel domain-containing protein [Vicinamibacterales bacterium]
MFGVLQGWLIERGVGEAWAAEVAMAIEATGVVLLAVLANVIAKRVVVQALQHWTARTTLTWDDRLVARRVFHRLSHLAPALVIYHFAPAVLGEHTRWITAVQQGALIYMLAAGAWVVSSLLDSAEDILGATRVGRDLPLKAFVQVGKIVLFFVLAIAVLSLVLGKSPVLLFSGLGAMTAVLMLVFKDAILGFVGGIQLSANQMVAPGDWIEMPKYGADGDVIEVALTTVKVQNWDKTITTIPTYALISESFKNWRGMSESGGRRIKRAINLDMTSVRFCDDEMLERFSHIQHVSAYLERKRQEITDWNRAHDVDPSSPVNGRRLTNLGTFRAYVAAYLRHHPLVHGDMTFLVRHLEPTAHGLPIEIYVFSRDQRWAEYENLQADIFDHILAIVPEFDLRVHQAPSGSDVRELMTALARG